MSPLPLADVYNFLGFVSYLATIGTLAANNVLILDSDAVVCLRCVANCDNVITKKSSSVTGGLTYNNKDLTYAIQQHPTSPPRHA